MSERLLVLKKLGRSDCPLSDMNRQTKMVDGSMGIFMPINVVLLSFCFMQMGVYGGSLYLV